MKPPLIYFTPNTGRNRQTRTHNISITITTLICECPRCPLSVAVISGVGNWLRLGEENRKRQLVMRSLMIGIHYLWQKRQWLQVFWDSRHAIQCTGYNPMVPVNELMKWDECIYTQKYKSWLIKWAEHCDEILYMSIQLSLW